MEDILWTAWGQRGLTLETAYAFDVAPSNDRLWIPIHNTYGDAIGTQGWGVNITPKYKILLQPNVKLTINLHNLNRAKEENTNWVCVVEGTLDMLSVYQSGVPSVVSTIGISPGLSDWRAVVLTRYFQNVIFMMDMDDAGREAAEIGKQNIINCGGNAIILDYSSLGCKDPNDVLLKYGENKLKKLIHYGVGKLGL